MAGFTPADGDLLEVRTCCYIPTQISLNVLHYQQFSHVGAGLTLQDISDAFDLLVNVQYKTWMAATARWRGVSTVNLMSPRTLPYVSVANDGIGFGGADLAPPIVSGLIATKGNLAGRENIGHIYPGFPSTAYVTAGGAQSAGGLAALTAIATIIGPTVTLTVGVNSVVLFLTVRHPDTVVAGVKIPQWSTVFTISPAPIFSSNHRRGAFGKENLPPF